MDKLNEKSKRLITLHDLTMYFSHHAKMTINDIIGLILCLDLLKKEYLYQILLYKGYAVIFVKAQSSSSTSSSINDYLTMRYPFHFSLKSFWFFMSSHALTISVVVAKLDTPISTLTQKFIVLLTEEQVE
ncbi:unnamed protein product [Rotaria socialis]|uniref:Uncharacterized protein n=1 Tax=Rotaria socialis TaxID=392032 RepID=A0A820KD24_9BILA|nr:unnamed protein product [Rotaria socialis]CAF4342154.1 unnamed protein product [Rotaria socialis]CAF4462254.1 unnamed protein product [Rotaria socialis]